MGEPSSNKLICKFNINFQFGCRSQADGSQTSATAPSPGRCMQYRNLRLKMASFNSAILSQNTALKRFEQEVSKRFTIIEDIVWLSDKWYMRSVLYFLFILFMEVTCGIILSIIYWLLSSFLFDEHSFGHSRTNEAIYYVMTLLPPFIYCWAEHSRHKRLGHKSTPAIYLSAGIVYLLGGFICLLIWTNFYLLGNWSLLHYFNLRNYQIFIIEN